MICRGLDAIDGSPSQRRTDQSQAAAGAVEFSPGSNMTESLDLSMGFGGETHPGQRHQGPEGSTWLDDDDATTIDQSEGM